jgi:formamidopyrimidine-DNA glycosylase
MMISDNLIAMDSQSPQGLPMTLIDVLFEKASLRLRLMRERRTRMNARRKARALARATEECDFCGWVPTRDEVHDKERWFCSGCGSALDGRRE